MDEREGHEDEQAERVPEEGQGSGRNEAEEQAGTPGQEGQGDDGQATGNPKSAG